MSLTSRRTVKARKRYKPEEIVAKLRQVDVLVSQGKKMVAEGRGHSRAFGRRIEEADSGAGRVLRLALRRADEDALRRNLRQSVHHHPHVHFPPLLAGIINRNPRDDEGREQEQRNGTLNPTLRAGGDVALIAWIRLGHSVLKVVTTQLQPQPSPPTHIAFWSF